MGHLRYPLRVTPAKDLLELSNASAIADRRLGRIPWSSLRRYVAPGTGALRSACGGDGHLDIQRNGRLQGDAALFLRVEHIGREGEGRLSAQGVLGGAGRARLDGVAAREKDPALRLLM